MNILHMKYAVEVARCGSINKAADSLLMNQPNLSRAIRELETSLGIAIFARSAKGIEVTPQGETFLRYASSILRQVDEMENMFTNNGENKKLFSVAVPRASYISHAFKTFSKAINSEKKAELFYKETDSQSALKCVLDTDYSLGIIRYPQNFERYYEQILSDKKLVCTPVTQFKYVVLMSRTHPLSEKEELAFSDLQDYIEIAHADPYVPSLPMSKANKKELPDNIGRRIYVFERASQFELLSGNNSTFMWVSPVPDETLERYGLVQIPCPENTTVYTDVLVHSREYKLGELDKAFVSELFAEKKRIFG